MSERRSTWCRYSECMAGLSATVDGGRIVSIEVDTEHPMGHHGSCGVCTHSAGQGQDPRRLLRPRRRTATGWEEVSWDVAIKEIGGKLKELRKAGGPNSIATYAGAPVGLNAAGTARTLAWTLGLGSARLFSPLATRGGPWVRAAELVLGHPVALQGDVGRAHFVILLGANQEAQGWGPMQAGRNHTAELAFSRKTKGTKVIAVDPRRTPLAAGADQHLAIRPGTELFFVLGMIELMLKNEWFEKQFVRDYTEGVEKLRELVVAWPADRCAEICGLTPEEIGGAALKFSRAAMALAHRSPQALDSEHGTLTAWALLVLHGLTANLLRPGGLYEARGVPDIHPVATQLPTAKAPRTRVGDYPLLLLQAPATVLADEILTPGDGAVKALICLHGDPARELPAGGRVRDALGQLDLLVCVDVADNETTKLAHWILPSTTPWERADLHLADTSILPYRLNQHQDVLVPPPGEAREEGAILAELFKVVGPTFSGGAFGRHLQALGTLLARGDMEAWLERAFQLSGTVTVPALKEAIWYGGDTNRAEWRVSTPSGKIQLAPDEIVAAFTRLEAPPKAHHHLLTSAARDPALRPFDRPAGADPSVSLHPSAGFSAGDHVRIRTTAGVVEAVVHLDESLRADTVDFPAGYGAAVLDLIPAQRLDPFVGTPALNGVGCTIERV